MSVISMSINISIIEATGPSEFDTGYFYVHVVTFAHHCESLNAVNEQHCLCADEALLQATWARNDNTFLKLWSKVQVQVGRYVYGKVYDTLMRLKTVPISDLCQVQVTTDSKSECIKTQTKSQV